MVRPLCLAWFGVDTTAVSLDEYFGLHGPSGDVGPRASIGCAVNASMRLEVAAGGTVWLDGRFGVGVGPSILWKVHPNLYLGARHFLALYPDAWLTSSPIAGVTIDADVAPFLEVGLAATIGRDIAEETLGVVARVGMLFQLPTADGGDDNGDDD